MKFNSQFEGFVRVFICLTASMKLQHVFRTNLALGAYTEICKVSSIFGSYLYTLIPTLHESHVEMYRFSQKRHFENVVNETNIDLIMIYSYYFNHFSTLRIFNQLHGNTYLTV
jgi:hypothetical protein